MQRNGFTLVELMVVIGVMAIVASLVVLTGMSPGRGPAETATRFASRLAAARDEAILTGRPISAWATASGYGFDQLRGGHWEALTARPFDASDWGRDITVTFAASDEDRARVRFDALGMPDQPMNLRIAHGGRIAEVSVEPAGDVKVE